MIFHFPLLSLSAMQVSNIIFFQKHAKSFLTYGIYEYWISFGKLLNWHHSFLDSFFMICACSMTKLLSWLTISKISAKYGIDSAFSMLWGSDFTFEFTKPGRYNFITLKYSHKTLLTKSLKSPKKYTQIRGSVNGCFISTISFIQHISSPWNGFCFL